MWLERFGTVDERIFIGFCVVVGVIVILAFINIVLLCTRTDHTPGRSVTSLLVYSCVIISCSVLLRGVQPKWKNTTIDNIQPLCSIFATLMSMGYTIYGVSLMTKSWSILIVYKWDRPLKESVISLVAWLFIIIAGVAVIVWEAVFSPTVAESRGLTASNVFSQKVFQCEGWPITAGTNHKQFAWRVSFSCYFAVFGLLAVASVPVHFTLRLDRHVSSPVRVALLVTILNAVCCVIVGLIVWFQYHHLTYDDSYKYAIIGSLQLWMLFVTLVSLLLAEVIVRCCLSATSYSTKRQLYELERNSSRDKLKTYDEYNKRLSVATESQPSAIIEGYYDGPANINSD